MIRNIKDPEKPYSLEELEIINEDSISLLGKLGVNLEYANYKVIRIEWKPTTPSCHLALNIGLSIRQKIKEELELKKTKIELIVKPGYHTLEDDSIYTN